MNRLVKAISNVKIMCILAVSLTVIFAFSVNIFAVNSTIDAFGGNYKVRTTALKGTGTGSGSVYAEHIKGAEVSDPTTSIEAVLYSSYSEIPQNICGSQFTTGIMSCAVTANTVLTIDHVKATSRFCGSYENAVRAY